VDCHCVAPYLEPVDPFVSVMGKNC
jgi:hypothetical protein